MTFHKKNEQIRSIDTRRKFSLPSFKRTAVANRDNERISANNIPQK